MKVIEGLVLMKSGNARGPNEAEVEEEEGAVVEGEEGVLTKEEGGGHETVDGVLEEGGCVVILSGTNKDELMDVEATAL